MLHHGPINPWPLTSGARTHTLSSEQQPDYDLVRPCDIRGLLHSHSRYADGAHSLRRMVETARALGLEYLGVSDHLRSGQHPEGLDVAGEDEQYREISQLRREFPDFDLLHGLEVDAAADGTVEIPAELGDHLDYVIVSLPDPEGHTKDSYTEAAIKAIRHPAVDVISKPLGGYMLTKPPVPLDMMRVLKAATEADTVVELDANPSCDDLDGTHCRLAAELGATLAINPNAHRAARLVDYRQGVQIAREMGLDCRQIVNVLTARQLRDRFGRNSHG
jgi:DNA polymerase (family 10)